MWEPLFSSCSFRISYNDWNFHDKAAASFSIFIIYYPGKCGGHGGAAGGSGVLSYVSEGILGV